MLPRLDLFVMQEPSDRLIADVLVTGQPHHRIVWSHSQLIPWRSDRAQSVQNFVTAAA